MTPPTPPYDPPVDPGGTSFQLDKSGTRGTLTIGLGPEENRARQLSSRLAEIAARLPHERPPALTPEGFETRFSADSAVRHEVERHLASRGLEVKASPDGRRLWVTGSLDRLEREFGAEFVGREAAGVRFRTALGPPSLPEGLAGRVRTIDGLDESPFASRFRPVVRGEESKHYRVRQIADLYRFPENRGRGQVVGIITLGGGYHRQDIEDFCKLEGIDCPEIVPVPVGTGGNRPASNKAIQALLEVGGYNPQPIPGGRGLPAGAKAPADDPMTTQWTIETTADVEIAAAAAPEATIVVFFAESNQPRAQVDALVKALGSDLEPRLRPDVLSCSWGQVESTYPLGSRMDMEDQLKRAACQGVSVCFASGDMGGGLFNYPACSAYTLACGGSAIVTPPAETPKVEKVWRENLGQEFAIYAATGGGMSTMLAQPPWQKEITGQVTAKTGIGAVKCALPDVAAHSAVATGYLLIMGGSLVGIGGTSCATPLWAGLLARVNVANADLDPRGYRVGLVGPALYRPELAAAFQQITEGDNGLYSGSAGWNPCTGLGRPIGVELARALRGGR